ncbi:MAG: sugar phosphate isomerase/epimerase family protein [Oscillospiraceae bacterium]
MRYGIYYAYWEKEWGGNFVPYIEKVKALGFDILEVACGAFNLETDGFFRELRAVSEGNGIVLTGGYGPRAEHNFASKDPAVVKKAFSFYKDVFRKMDIAGIKSLGGALYSYWPVDFKAGIDKAGDFKRSTENMRVLAEMAGDFGITLLMESVNRFEGYMINEANEAVEYVRMVGKPNVKILLDTFHMNIEEDSFTDAIQKVGPLLGRLHVGEANRRPPREGRMPWREIADVVHDTGYDGDIVMEPFVTMGGQVGRDISIWRDISRGASPEDLDRDAAESVAFLRRVFGA